MFKPVLTPEPGEPLTDFMSRVCLREASGQLSHIQFHYIELLDGKIAYVIDYIDLTQPIDILAKTISDIILASPNASIFINIRGQQLCPTNHSFTNPNQVASYLSGAIDVLDYIREQIS